MKLKINLNADVAEGYGRWTMGNDKDIINEAIQTTGATSLIDIVKIIKHIKEKTGKDIDENLAISILQERLNNL